MKKLFIGLVAALLSTLSMAAVELNTATAADLDTIKGIGPKMSASILAERQKNGNFKDWADFSARVKGVGDKNSVKFSQSGLTVSGKALSGAAAASTGSPATNKPVTTTATNPVSAKAATPSTNMAAPATNKSTAPAAK